MNNRFLEEYKRVDNICRDIYQSDSGITNYINLMRDAKNYRDQNIAEWDAVLARLMALRHIRNKLTHDVGTLEMELCREDDVLWLEEFGDSLLDATDPLAKHYRSYDKNKKASKKKKTDTPVSNAPIYKTTPIYKKRKKIPKIIKMLVTLAILTLLFYLLVEAYKYLGA